VIGPKRAVPDVCPQRTEEIVVESGKGHDVLEKLQPSRFR
jgi:hypothetical protein